MQEALFSLSLVTLKMDTIYSSETSVPLTGAMRSHITEDSIFQILDGSLPRMVVGYMTVVTDTFGSVTEPW
jgi:hypothetical protein